MQVPFMFSPQYEEMKKLLRKTFDDKEHYFQEAGERTDRLLGKMLTRQSQEERWENTLRLAVAQMGIFLELDGCNAIMRLIAESTFSLTKVLHNLSLTTEQVKMLRKEMDENRPTIQSLRAAVKSRATQLEDKTRYYKKLEQDAKRRKLWR